MVTLDLHKRYTYAEYFSWQDGKLYELINGFVKLMSPAPSKKHAIISGNIFADIKILFRRKKSKCQIFHAPFDVRLPKLCSQKSDSEIDTVVQPDICVVCDLSKLDERGCIGAPDLIVEVISPATAKRDFHDKFMLYQEHGVREYWIVQPKEEVLTAFQLGDDNKYNDGQVYTINDTVTTKLFEDLAINLRDVFEDI